MKLLSLPLLVLALSLTACGAVKDYNNARHMEGEHTRLVDEINSESWLLLILYSVNLSPTQMELSPDSEITAKSFFGVSSNEKRNDVRRRIYSVLTKAGRALEIEAHKDINNTTTNQKVSKKNAGKYSNIQRRGPMYLKALDEHEKSLVGKAENAVSGLLKAASDKN